MLSLIQESTLPCLTGALLEGFGGLEKLATITVTGKVAEGTSADLLIVNARAVRSGK